MAQILVSCHLQTWKRDFAKALQEAQELGYHGCEPALRFVREYAGEPEQFRERLRSHGLSISALYEAYSFTDPDASEDIAIRAYTTVAQLVAACGGDVVVIGPGMTRSRGESPPSVSGLQKAAGMLTEVAKRCADLGVRACLHPHLWSEIQTQDEIYTVMDESGDALLLCPDTGHLLGAGVDPVELVKRYPQRIGHVHLKDLTIGGNLENDPDVIGRQGLLPFCELGRGAVDLKAFVRCLREIDYSGWATIELDDSDAPRESLAICRDYVMSELDLPVLFGEQEIATMRQVQNE